MQKQTAVSQELKILFRHVRKVTNKTISAVINRSSCVASSAWRCRATSRSRTTVNQPSTTRRCLLATWRHRHHRWRHTAVTRSSVWVPYRRTSASAFHSQPHRLSAPTLVRPWTHSNLEYDFRMTFKMPYFMGQLDLLYLKEEPEAYISRIIIPEPVLETRLLFQILQL